MMFIFFIKEIGRKFIRYILYAFTLFQTSYCIYANKIEFNTDVLSLNDRENIDLSKFSKPGYLMPGEYDFTIYLNKKMLANQNVNYYISPIDKNSSLLCLTPYIIKLFSLKKEMENKLLWWNNGECLLLDSLPGTAVRTDIANSELNIDIPQAYLEYMDENWEPPERWDDGLYGAILDYNVNTQIYQQLNYNDEINYYVNGNGVFGINVDEWRARTHWQMDANNQLKKNVSDSIDFNRYYVYRAIKPLRAKVTLGDNYYSSDIFEGFSFTGVSLISDIRMIPPNLRLYAPEIMGIATSNATVKVSQKGNIIYQTQVAPGLFKIRDLNSSIFGKLDVEIIEGDGLIKNYSLNTVNVPYLTRPGQFSYKLATGYPSNQKKKINNDLFLSGEFSWGINNELTLFGGGIASENYSSTAIGIGHDLKFLGALSVDTIHTRTYLKKITDNQNKTYLGNSYRLNYSKYLEFMNGNINFSGYRFTKNDFMSMLDYNNALYDGYMQYNKKNMYTISYTQRLENLGISTYFNYQHQSYWDQLDNDRFSISLSKYLNVKYFKNANVNFTVYHNRYNNTSDDGLYFTLSFPLNNESTITLGNSRNKNDNSMRISYSEQLDERNNYQINLGQAESKPIINGFYTYLGDFSVINTNVNYQQDRYRSIGMSFQGGITGIQNGIVLHRNNQMGGTRIFIDTDGVSDVPLRGNGSIISTNENGQTVITDVNSFDRNQISIDLNSLNDDVQVTQSVKQLTLTEGAIGYRRFDVLLGTSAMAILRFAENNGTPPLGAIVINSRGQQVGIVADDGNVYLSGLNTNDILQVYWDEKPQCEVEIPNNLPINDLLFHKLFLPCYPVNR